ncbi:MAG: metallophosphoesterase [Solirubrobacterales bacterium]|nr:metallophosphoesterase [Solirubrobacterales bacterium]
MTIVQLTDLHIGATHAGDPAADLRAAIGAVNEQRAGSAPDAVLVTGDLVNDGRPEQYAEVTALLATLDAPVHVLPGNHDDRAGLRAAFPLGALEPDDTPADAPYRWAAVIAGVRVVACDTLIPGTDDGAFPPEQADWLDRTLAQDASTPTLVAMHHPPFAVGVPILDAMLPAPGERSGLAAVLARHPQVRRVACGHVHLAAAASCGGAPVLTAPSTWRPQFGLDIGDPELRILDGPAGYVIHALLDDELVAHVRPVDLRAG